MLWVGAVQNSEASLFPAAEAERAQDEVVELQRLLARLQERLEQSPDGLDALAG
jgi:hypothetical protein